jgi:hypothetical protein
VIVSTMLRVLRVLGAAQEWRTEVIERVLTEGDSLSEVSTMLRVLIVLGGLHPRAVHCRYHARVPCLGTA